MSRDAVHAIHVLAGVLLLVILMALFGGWTGEAGHAGIDAAWVLVTFGVWPALWLTAAFGYGWPLRRWLFPQASARKSLQIGAGVAVLLTLDQGLGALGFLQMGGSIGAWAVIVAGLALVVWMARGDPGQRGTGNGKWAIGNVLAPIAHRPLPIAYCLSPVSWLWCIAPAVAVLLLAACSAPGWLWATEFGGYDALSYHLQLPKEWLALGRIEPLQHNVYSFLPGYVEGAYYHLAVLVGDGVTASYAAQLLHVLLTLILAAMVAMLAAQSYPSDIAASPARLEANRRGYTTALIAAVVAAGSLLGTPWIIVIGSLAYNETALLLMLAAGLLAVLDESLTPARRGALVGLFAGAACGAKLTSVGFVAAPLATALLLLVPARHWPKTLLAAGGAGLLVLLPYLLRNYAFAAQPLFPFASGILGTAHWTPEQAHIWWRGHQSELGLGPRLTELWHQFFRFGIGANPHPGEPWNPQWSILPWLALAAMTLGLWKRESRRITLVLAAMLVVQIVFWLGFTHLKPRFLLPAVVPMCNAVGIAAALLGVRRSVEAHRFGWFILLALLAWCVQPVFIFRGERGGAPAAFIGGTWLFTGDDLSPSDRRIAGETASPAIAVNHLLPEGSRVLLVGHATPLYFRLDRIHYNTTWDRGPLSMLMRQKPDDGETWFIALRDAGFTHLLVDETMLEIWERSGWNDPLLTVERVRRITAAHAEAMFHYPGRVTLFEIRD